jgi:RND family efflux transporter MFP subunit
MNKKYIALGLIVISIIGIGTVIKSKANKSDAYANEIEKRIAVEVDTVYTSTIADVVYTIGKTEPGSIYTVNGLVNGTVKSTKFNVGDEVKKGDVLFTIDVEAFSADKNAKLTQSENGVSSAKSSYEDALKQYESKKLLFENGAVSEFELSSYKNKLENAKNALDNAVSSLNSANKSYNTQSKNYIITSPVDGLITSKTVEVGSMASNQTGYKIITTGNMKITGSITSKYINEIEEGQDVKININTLNKEFDGSVASISYSSQTGSYPIEVAISEQDDMIKQGMYSELWITLNTNDNAVVIPREVLLSS